MMVFHVKRFTLSIIVSLSFQLSARSQGSIVISQQDFVYDLAKDTAIENKLISLPGYKNLSLVEKETIYWMNFVRIKPSDFSEWIIKPFLKQFPEAKSSYSNSLIKTLEQMNPVKFITPQADLNRLAMSHSSDLGKTGANISHSSSRGESFQQRMNKAGITDCIAENVFEGREQALQSIIFLLIDKGVPNVGHRKNILDDNMHSVGLSFYPIKGKTGYFLQVQNFSCASTQ